VTDDGDQHRRVDVLGIVLICACAVLLAILEVMLVPLYWGSVIVPISAVLAVLGNWIFPRVGFRMAGRVGAVLPLLLWLVVVFALGLMPRPEGDVMVPGAGAPEYVFFAVLFGGSVVGVISAVIVTTPRPATPDRTD
jgi:hypothetical protein